MGNFNDNTRDTPKKKLWRIVVGGLFWSKLQGSNTLEENDEVANPQVTVTAEVSIGKVAAQLWSAPGTSHVWSRPVAGAWPKAAFIVEGGDLAFSVAVFNAPAMQLLVVGR